MSLENSSGTRRWKRYPKYKDSGVEWLGEVPEEWSVTKFPYAIDFQEGPGIMAEDFQNSGIPLIRICNIQGDQVNLDGCNFLSEGKVRCKWSHFRLLQYDLLISSSASTGMVSEVPKNAEGAIAYTGIIRLRPKQKIANKQFIKWIVSSQLFSTQIDQLKTGSTIQHFGPFHLRQILITIPPLNELNAISTFLNREMTYIDTLITKKQRQIMLLKEKRAALIDHSIIKGLNPNSKMKASGIKWVDKVPDQWQVLLMKRIVNLKHGHQFRDYDFVRFGIPIIKITELGYNEKLNLKNPSHISIDRIKEFQDFLILKNSVLMALTGGTIGKTVWVDKDYGIILQNYRVGNFLPKTEFLSQRYLFFLLLSDFIQNQIFLCVAQNAQPNLGKEEFDNFIIFVPPLSEQSTITAVLDQEIPKIDNLIGTIEDSMGKLHEYRTALISAAVTGKIDVRQEISA
jgi:type I restriction enzyme, S subunit